MQLNNQFFKISYNKKSNFAVKRFLHAAGVVVNHHALR